MLSRLAGIYRQYFVVVLGASIVGLTLIAWSHRFIQDDAFISFRYAENLVHGHGLVWNIGERIEGYTNFLWTLLIAAAIGLRIDPITASFALGLSCFVVSLIFTYRLALLVSGSRNVALVTILLLGLNYTFSSYATGGLETQMQTCLFVASCYLCIRGVVENQWSIGRLTALSALLTAAVLTRLDSLIACVVIFFVALRSILGARAGSRSLSWPSLALLLPFIVLIGGWLLWKLSYYGDILPNSYYCKASSITSPMQGVRYLGLFGMSYFLFPLAPFVIIGFRELFKRSSALLWGPMGIIVLWLGYVVKIGGDFMEFRFLVPILPLAFVTFTWMIYVLVRPASIRLLLIAVVLFGNEHHASTFKFNPIDGVEDIQNLYGHIRNENENWGGSVENWVRHLTTTPAS